MNKLGEIVYKKIQRISPSQYGSMKACSYKSVLAQAFDKTPLLPVSPNAYLGSVIHKVLEKNVRGDIKNLEDFNLHFNIELESMENSLLKQGFEFMLPLQKNVMDFGLKKVLLKKHIRTDASTVNKSTKSTVYSEKWIETKDKKIGGKVDLVIESPSYIEILDFKTGAITQDFLDDAGEMFSEIKPEYSEQLKLYAYAYYETNGKYPDKLTLVDLSKQKFDVVFTSEECQKLYLQAKDLLEQTNNSVDTKLFKANPSESNCKYCLYRPGCSDYLDYILNNNPFNDVSGILNNIVQYQNGNISLFIENKIGLYTITGITKIKYEDLVPMKGKKVNVFNLKKEAMNFVYSSKKTTTIYE